MAKELAVMSYHGRPIALLGDSAKAMVLFHQGHDRILVCNSTSKEGAMFIDEALLDGRLKVVQRLEAETPAELCAVNKQNLFFRKSKEIVAHNEGLFIAKVLATEKDDLRVCYSSENDAVPTLVATPAHECFNGLDAGNVIDHLTTYYQTKTETALDLETVSNALPASREAKRAADKQLAEKLTEIRTDYIAKFIRKEIDVLFVSIFMLEGNVMTYGGVSITVNDRLPQTLQALSEEIARVAERSDAERQRAFEFERLLPLVVTTSGNVTIDGVPLTYMQKEITSKETADKNSVTSTLHYINGRKISAPDLDEMINRVTCYRNQAELYNQFVAQVAAISLKFHRANTNGVMITERALEELGDAMVREQEGGGKNKRLLPHDYSDGNNAGITVTPVALPFRKTKASERGELLICGLWRKVEDFDTLVEACAGKEPSKHKDRVYANHGNNAASLTALRRLFYIDRGLQTADRMVTGLCKPRESEHSSHRLDEENTAALTFGQEFLKQFKIDVTKRLDAIRRSRELFDRIVLQEKVSYHPGKKNDDGELEDESWVVAGKSGRRYRVDKTGSVTNLTSGSHVCIVNGGGKDLGGWDYLSSLIAALANDTMVAQSVGTLGLKPVSA